MTDDDKVAIANLGFFKSAILDPVMLDYLIASDIHPDSVTPAFWTVETALWLKLGFEIGYFDGDNALEVLFQSSEQLLAAWSELVVRELVSPEFRRWCDFITSEGKPALDKERFLSRPESGFGGSRLLPAMFQHYLLLTAELVGDEDAKFFLDSIGWTTDEEWQLRREGHGSWTFGTVESLCIGFANTAQHLEESQDYFYEAGVRAAGSLDSSEGNRLISHENEFVELEGRSRVIRSWRFNLGKANVKERYFKFAGDLVAELKQGGPTWMDTRLSTFNMLRHLLAQWTGVLEKQEIQRLWSLYTGNVDGTQEITLDLRSTPTEKGQV